jgi:hypothetical protein
MSLPNGTKYFSAGLFVTTVHRSSDRIIMEHTTNTATCLALGTHYIQHGMTAQHYNLCFPGQNRPDFSVFH